MPVHGLVEPALPARERRAPDLGAAPDVLDRPGVQHEAHEPRHIGGVVGVDEAIDERHRRPRATGCDLGILESRATPVQRRLHRPDGRRQDVSDLLQAVVEELLQDDGRPLLRGEPLHQHGPRVARRAGGRRAGAALARLGEGRRFAFAAADRVDPEIGRGPEQVGTRILDADGDAAERPEGSQQGVLYEVLRVPDIAGQPAAEAVEPRSEGRQEIDVAVPGCAQIVPEAVR